MDVLGYRRYRMVRNASALLAIVLLGAAALSTSITNTVDVCVGSMAAFVFFVVWASIQSNIARLRWSLVAQIKFDHGHDLTKHQAIDLLIGRHVEVSTSPGSPSVVYQAVVQSDRSVEIETKRPNEIQEIA